MKKLINIWCISYSFSGKKIKYNCLQRAIHSVSRAMTESIILKGFNVINSKQPSREQNSLVHIHRWKVGKTSETAQCELSTAKLCPSKVYWSSLSCRMLFSVSQNSAHITDTSHKWDQNKHMWSTDLIEEFGSALEKKTKEVYTCICTR